MITFEQLIEVCEKSVSNISYSKNNDYIFNVIKFLREKIPYDVCKSIILCAEHDQIYFCDVETALPYLSLEDWDFLFSIGLCCDFEHGCFYMWV